MQVFYSAQLKKEKVSYIFKHFKNELVFAGQIFFYINLRLKTILIFSDNIFVPTDTTDIMCSD